LFVNDLLLRFCIVSFIERIRASKNRILEHLAVKEGQEVQLKELVLSRFEFLIADYNADDLRRESGVDVT